MGVKKDVTGHVSGQDGSFRRISVKDRWVRVEYYHDFLCGIQFFLWRKGTSIIVVVMSARGEIHFVYSGAVTKRCVTDVSGMRLFKCLDVNASK